MGRHKKEQLKTEEERMPVSVERMEAIKAVYNDLCNCTQYSVVAEKLQNDLYGIGKHYSDSASYHIIREARRLLQNDFKDYLTDAREQIWLSVMDLATESKMVGDRGVALRCLEYLGKLFGLEEKKQIDVNLNGEIEIDFGIE